MYQEYTYSKRGPIVQYIQIAGRGSMLLMYQEYTYSKKGLLCNGGTRYKCSSQYIEIAGRGSKLLMYQEYTYSKSGSIRNGGSRYTCSCNFSKNCKAHIHVSKDNIVIKAFTEHNHLPPKYAKTQKGYIKI
ncbi:uncharacterized protein LOC128200160 [Galleria mellonella]|uniref:Uncharacterized protein LOC128200160 n=1 Tax=Galleria mellonella TaxID=7137 RepID=A0ABM3MAX0_GALME|nr:uncharacterized protein LOC128200160 [Galleria mellonella]